MNATTKAARQATATSWWRRLRPAAPRARETADDMADLGLCFGLEAALHVDEETRALAAACDAAERRSAEAEVRAAY